MSARRLLENIRTLARQRRSPTIQGQVFGEIERTVSEAIAQLDEEIAALHEERLELKRTGPDGRVVLVREMLP